MNLIKIYLVELKNSDHVLVSIAPIEWRRYSIKNFENIIAR